MTDLIRANSRPRQIGKVKPDTATAIREKLGELLERERARHVEPHIVDANAYRDAVRSLIKMGGTEPNAEAPPRRRFE